MIHGSRAMPALAAALVLFAVPGAQAAPAQKNHIVHAAPAERADVDFIVNGNDYRVVGECSGWRDGDRVVFADGSTAATCGAVQLTNIDRGSTCRLECE